MCIIVIIAIALSCPVIINAYIGENKKFKLLYKWIFFTFGQKPNPHSPIMAFAKKITGISRFESVQNVGENIKSRGFTDTVKDFFNLLSNICKKIKYLLPHCKIRSLGLTVITAGEDPQATALGFGVVCSAAYPVLGLIYANTKPSKQPPEMNISCDFTTTEPVFDFNCTFSCSAFFILVAVLHLAFKDWRKRRKLNHKQ